MPIDDLVAEPPGQTRKFGHIHHAHGDGRAMPPPVPLVAFDGMAQGVPVVEDLLPRWTPDCFLEVPATTSAQTWMARLIASRSAVIPGREPLTGPLRQVLESAGRR